MKAWKNVIIQWANCLAESEGLERIESLNSLNDGKLFYDLINIGTHLQLNQITDGDYKATVMSFLKDEYPNFRIITENLFDNDMTESLYIGLLVLSRLAQEPCFHEFMCKKLDTDCQTKIKSLLEVVFPLEKKLTREDLLTVVMESDQDDQPKTPCSTSKQALENFFRSPGTPLIYSAKKVSDYNRQIRRLKVDLENERYEKSELQEDLKIQQHKVKELQIKLQDCSKELKHFKINVAKADEEECDCKENFKLSEAARKKEILELEDSLTKLQTENFELQNDKSDLVEEVNKLRLQCQTLQKENLSTENVVESLVQQLRKKDEELNLLKIQNDELSSHIREKSKSFNQSFETDDISLIASVSSPNPYVSFNKSEALSSVIDLQLQESRKEIEVLKKMFDRFDSLLTVNMEEYKKMKLCNFKLTNEIVYLKSHHEKLMLETVDSYEVTVKSLEKNIESRTNLATELENQLNNVTKESKDRETMIKQLEYAISSYEKEKIETLKEFESSFSRLEKELREKSSKITHMGNLLSNLKNELESSNLSVISQKNEITDLTSHLENYKSKCDKLTEDLEKKILHISGLENCLVEQEHLMSKLNSNILESNSEIENLCQQKSQLNEVLAEKSKTLEDKILHISGLENFIQEQKLIINSLEEDVSNRNAEIEDFKQHKIQLEEESNNKIKEILTLKNSVGILENEIKNLALQKSQLDTETSTLKDDIENKILCISDLEDSLSKQKLLVNTLEEKLQISTKEMNVKCDEMQDIIRLLDEEKLLVDTLRKNISEKDFEINDLIQQKSELQRKLTIKSKEICGLEDRSNEQLLLISKKNEEIENFTLQRSQLDAEILALKEELGNKVLHISNLENSLDDKKIFIDSLQSNVREGVAEIEDLVQQNSKLKSEISTITQELAKKSEELERKTLSLSVLESSFEEQKLLIDSLKHDVLTTNEEIKNLASDKFQLEEKLSIKSEEILNLENSLSEHKSLISNFEEKIVDKNAEISALREDLDSKISYISDQEKNISEKDAEIEDLTLKLDVKLKELKELEICINEKENQLCDSQSQISEILLELQNCQEENKDRELTISELDKKIEQELFINATLSSNMALLEENISKKEITINDLNDEIQFQQKEIVNKDTQIADLLSDISKYNLTVTDLTNQISCLQTEKMEKAEELNEIRSFVTNLQENVLSFKQEILERDLQIEKLDGTISELQSAIEDTRDKLNSVKCEVDDKTNLITNLKSSVSKLQGEISASQGHIVEKEALIAELQEKLGNNDALVSQLKKESADAEMEKERLQTLISKLRKDLDEAQNYMVEKNARINKIVYEVSLKEVEVQDLRNMILDKDSKIQNYEISSTEMKREITNLQSSINDNETLISKLKGDVDELEKIRLDQELELSKLKSEITTNQTCIVNKSNEIELLALLNKDLGEKLNDRDNEIGHLKSSMEELKREINDEEIITTTFKNQLHELQKVVNDLQKNCEESKLIVKENIQNLRGSLKKEGLPDIDSATLAEICQVEKDLINSICAKRNQICKIYSDSIVLNDEILAREFDLKNLMSHEILSTIEKRCKELHSLDSFNKMLQNIIENVKIVTKEPETNDKQMLNDEDCDHDTLGNKVGLLILAGIMKVQQNLENEDANIQLRRSAWEKFCVNSGEIESLQNDWLRIAGNMKNLLDCETSLLNDLKQMLEKKEAIESEFRSLCLPLENFDQISEKLLTLRNETRSFAQSLREYELRVATVDNNKENVDSKQIHEKYEAKLEKMKEKLKTAYTEQVTKLKKEQEAAAKEKIAHLQSKLEYQCHKHLEEIKKYKKHVSELTTQLWDVGEKLLIEKQTKEEFRQKIDEIESNFHQRLVRERAIDSYQQSTSRRNNVQNMHFNVEDEEGEIFDTTSLSDIDRHRSNMSFMTNSDLSRLSILQMRNSKCKPHLKSSYPAETQFHTVNFTEEDIKSGNVSEDMFNNSLSQSLLTGKKVKGKERSKISYKKPGPPTPQRSGGRLSLGGIMSRSPATRILRDQNAGAALKTKSGLADMSLLSKRSEDIDSPKRSRRFSNIFSKKRTQNERK